jgi:FlaA1/EpsC-like NDP-sugar epimerase
MDGLDALRKRGVIFTHDVLWVPLTIALAYVLRFNLALPEAQYLGSMLLLIAIAAPIHATTFWLFGCYRGVWRFASVPDLMRIIKAVTLGALATGLAAFLFTRLHGVPRSVLVLYPILLVAGVMGTRVMNRVFKEQATLFRMEGADINALIVGAGRGGELLVRDLLRHGPFLPVAFVDDDPAKLGQDIHGVRVRGTLQDLPELIPSLQVQTVLIALPSASRQVMNNVVNMCAEANVSCRTLPALSELADGQVEVSRLRPVTVEDLLGRDPVHLNEPEIAEFLKGQCVLVTGGGGSIGSELCRQIAAYGPSRLIVFDQGEFNLYNVDHDLRRHYPQVRIHAVLGDVRDAPLVDLVFRTFKPQVVFHAAAYKHVPLVEDNPLEGVSNNVFGTRVLADAALRYGTKNFVLISTDKTVNPVNYMGASKRVCELYCQSLNAEGETHFITTRFGNVLGSCGSVVPLFERQIAEGGPVTVTHPDITRYFMTIPEAVGLILQAGAMGRGGEIYVLDMGEPIRIRDLAEKMIRLSGLHPDHDVKIEYTGLRHGEKLHEELFYAEEELRGTGHPKLLLAGGAPVDGAHLREALEDMATAVKSGSVEQLSTALRAVIPSFTGATPSTLGFLRTIPGLRVVK